VEVPGLKGPVALMLDTVPAIVILLNAIMIGMSTDIEPESPGWEVCEIVFTTFFTMEGLLKMRLMGLKDFYCGPVWYWNWFDVFCLVIAYADVFFTFWFSEKTQGIDASSNDLGLGQLTFLKIVRLGRLTRLVRLLRFKIFNELKMMVQGIVSGLRVLFWAIVLLFFVVYTLGVVGRKLFGDTHKEFSTVPAATFSMFRCFTDGCSAYDGTPLHEALRESYGGLFTIMYFLTFLFVTIGIFNLIMAIFIENVAQAALRRKTRELSDNAAKHERHLRQAIGRLLRAGRAAPDVKRLGSQIAWLASDRTGSSASEEEEAPLNDVVITREVFNLWLDDRDLCSILDECLVEISNKQEIFDVLDVGTDGFLDVEDLVGGLMRLRGPVTKNDILSIRLRAGHILRVVDGGRPSRAE